MKTEVEDCCELSPYSNQVDPNSSTLTTTSTTAAAHFNPEERLALTSAWIAAALTHEAQDSQEFWTKIQSDYADNLPLTGRLKTAEGLRVQWEEMHPHLVEFLTLFMEKWSKCQINLRYALSRRKEAFKCAKAAVRAKNKRFGDWDSAWELVNHEKWQNVLSPRIIQHAVSVEKVSARQSRAKSRREDAEGAEDRRVKPRRDVDGSQQRAKPSMADEVELKKVVAQGIQLELDIMTRSEDGLSAEAVE
ncbi:hypothetical protein PHYSODRAFT_308181 [Phytophthora sojae]|uniref:Uncharacterized protein n=1 Tax=Phytophthora sojae (strain P6497) TaxID=1094619 RepID=G5A2Z4_PHYSP|nr:hypothetical protein PHYSODRAFT_338737 [Phytophthora sojae]XP_009539935.1 hypothetical protein PHYSODRAFT_308181 [Phytophthora sojae]EGZ04644.1 hypothetical protein PHYSODRAFT_308181 [Phytophthora sojae]EGZ10034.1 hypothetical protein PHYSODRAFT_338737 [Phytophthora sojae]|eukprot:XP_009534895.1 hypothetical protein PHYSODRAFT_338737 [Phytophthora sojae]